MQQSKRHKKRSFFMPFGLLHELCSIIYYVRAIFSAYISSRGNICGEYLRKPLFLLQNCFFWSLISVYTKVSKFTLGVHLTLGDFVASVNRDLTVRRGLAPRRQTWQWVDCIEYFVFRANFDRYGTNARTQFGRLWREHHDHTQTAVTKSAC